MVLAVVDAVWALPVTKSFSNGEEESLSVWSERNKPPKAKERADRESGPPFSLKMQGQSRQRSRSESPNHREGRQALRKQEEKTAPSFFRQNHSFYVPIHKTLVLRGKRRYAAIGGIPVLLLIPSGFPRSLFSSVRRFFAAGPVRPRPAARPAPFQCRPGPRWRAGRCTGRLAHSAPRAAPTPSAPNARRA